MRLLSYDAYTSLTRFMPRDAELVVIDVGANEGQTIRRIRQEFAEATIYAFEPSPDTFKRLECSVAHDERVRVFQLACGSKGGTVDFHVTSNHWCSSVLPPSDLGKRFYGDWYKTESVVRVPMITLDEWAAQHSIPTVDLLKVDAQGYDLEVLKGARRLLSTGVKAINCECQFAPEYVGCATFSQIDLFLAENGFALHQLHEVHERGDEEQTTYGDGLWLRTDVLEALRKRTDWPDLSPLGRVRAALEAAKGRGGTRAALYGSGRHTQGIVEHLDQMPLPVEAIIDDNPALRGSRFAGRDIISPEMAISRGIGVVVLSSDAHEAALWDRCAPLRDSGIDVIPLYNRSLQSSAPALARGAA